MSQETMQAPDLLGTGFARSDGNGQGLASHGSLLQGSGLMISLRERTASGIEDTIMGTETLPMYAMGWQPCGVPTLGRLKHTIFKNKSTLKSTSKAYIF